MMTFTQEHLIGHPDLARRVFELAGVEFKSNLNGSEYRTLCPFHPDRDHSSLAIRLDRAVYCCRTCGAAGDARRAAEGR